MFGIDTWLEGSLHRPSPLGIILLMSLVLGLRHAGDPDHLAAVTLLIASEQGVRLGRKAAVIGLSWGLGHATTLTLLGVPLVRFNRYLPELVQQVAETVVGVLIVLLALRLLWQWQRGRYHAHPHRHADHSQHRHLHAHSRGATHDHPHLGLQRTPLSAYGIGVIHGIGGSAGLTLLLLSTIRDRTEATVALLLFATGTALSMSMLSAGLGWIIVRGPVARHVNWAAPTFGVLSLAFGVYYLLGTLGMVQQLSAIPVLGQAGS